MGLFDAAALVAYAPKQLIHTLRMKSIVVFPLPVFMQSVGKSVFLADRIGLGYTVNGNPINDKLAVNFHLSIHIVLYVFVACAC